MNIVFAAAQAVLTVFAAASLHSAFPALGKQFEAAHPGVSVRFDFAGSQALEAQLENGAPGDIFASADKRWMDKAVDSSVVQNPQIFAGNELVLVAPVTSDVFSPLDLAKKGVKLVMCAPTVPCGLYAQSLFEQMDRSSAFGPDYARSVRNNVVSEELDVESVLAKVTLREADAGVVYQSDAFGRKDIRTITLPALSGTPIAYYLGAVRATKNSSLAVDFIAFVRSADGQKTLKSFGFSAAP